MARFSVRFLGCKVSQADASLIRDALIDAGHVETTAEAAEVHVVNTCALTVEAEKKSRRQAHRGARNGRVFVSGCAVNLNAAQFAGPNVTTLPGSADRAAAEIVEHLGGGRPLACADDAPRPNGRTRAFLKVQNGCDHECAFCIIPTTRGGAESRPAAWILAEARRRIADGHPELVLTGINIGSYHDRESGRDLGGLVRLLGRIEGLRRLRISSIEPGDVSEPLLEAMADTPVVGPHMHIPLQSAAPGVLDAMRRSYTLEQYLAAIERARRILPGLNLTTDAIVGFPAEDEPAFAQTLALCEELAFSKIHVFPYSPRPGTVAADMEGRPHPDVLRERSARLRGLSDRLGFAHRLARVGSDDVVLVEKRHEDGTLTGFGADYTRVVLPSGAGEPGGMVPVRIAGLAGEHLDGRPR
ncbi:MAG TPA: MiaB/RimO family radical SAM methylthiotransferase [Miltoncostaeaceae bacterium]|nr:MiaB/RimO family radical SAM methylthiotransferase [Miltoncostaeaceae bacterium]